MAKTYYNKLVRDRIPEIIQSKGKNCEFDILDDEAYLKALDAKLDEEVAEYHENPSVEELADIYTVFMSILLARGIKQHLIVDRAIEKGEERGYFDGQLFLKWVDDATEGEQS